MENKKNIFTVEWEIATFPVSVLDEGDQWTEEDTKKAFATIPSRTTRKVFADEKDARDYFDEVAGLYEKCRYRKAIDGRFIACFHTTLKDEAGAVLGKSWSAGFMEK